LLALGNYTPKWLLWETNSMGMGGDQAAKGGRHLNAKREPAANALKFALRGH